MRFASILIVSLLIGCSSEDKPADTGPKVNACSAAGGVCAENFPFLCAPGDEPATDPSLATACGKSVGENPRDVSCCLRGLPHDTGVPDTGAPDADATTDADATDADATDATDASDATDATDAADASDGADAD